MPELLILAEDGTWETPSWGRTNDDDVWVPFGWKAVTYDGHVHYRHEKANVRAWLVTNGYQDTGDGTHYRKPV
jgi:hypothetical protein